MEDSKAKNVFSIKRLIVTRGVSREIGKGNWDRVDYTIEADVFQEDKLDTLRSNIEKIEDFWINEWLKKRTSAEFNPNKIQWINTKGSQGPFELSKDYNNEEFRKLMSLLRSRGGFDKNGFSYWILTDKRTIARRRKSVRATK